MIHRMKMLSLGIGLVLSLFVAACGPETTGGAGGAGGAGGSGGSGGGSAMMLASQGTVIDTCGPADGPALDFRIGTPSDCAIAPSAEPFVHVYAYPGSTGGFAPGQAWTLGAPIGSNEAIIEWFPEGSGNNHGPAASGDLEVVSVGAESVRVKYSFVTVDGEIYEGEADVVICPSTPMCG